MHLLLLASIDECDVSLFKNWEKTLLPTGSASNLIPHNIEIDVPLPISNTQTKVMIAFGYEKKSENND